MALEVVTGAPFAGKAEFVRGEIERREQAGELGLIMVDYTAIYAAVVVGEQSQLRDAALTDTGAARAAGAAYDFMVGAVLARQLSSFVTTQSPRRALAISDRFGGAPVWDVQANVGDLAVRVRSHAADISGRVARAGDGVEAGCGRQVAAYLGERHMLAGRAREVVQVRRGTYRKGGLVEPFNEQLFVSGLTPAGRLARDELIAAGNQSPSPSEVFRLVLQNLGRRP